jgi:hypothetical protein
MVNGICADYGIKRPFGKRKRLSGVNNVKAHTVIEPPFARESICICYAVLINVHPGDLTTGGLAHEKRRPTCSARHIQDMRRWSEFQPANKARQFIGCQPTSLAYIRAERFVANLGVDGRREMTVMGLVVLYVLLRPIVTRDRR